MITIGLLGGIASGKSVVAQHLQKLGAVVLDADRAGHEVLKLPHVGQEIRREFGDTVFDEAGQVSRPALAKLVFGRTPESRSRLARLEQISHPEIGGNLLKQMDDLRQAGNVPALVLDAPLMLKAGWDRFCDYILFVDAPRPLRLARAERRGWSQEDFAAREASQESLEVKRAAADLSIDNSGSISATYHQVEEFWRTHIG